MEQVSQGQLSAVARSALFDQLPIDVYQGDFSMQEHQLEVPYGNQGQ